MGSWHQCGRKAIKVLKELIVWKAKIAARLVVGLIMKLLHKKLKLIQNHILDKNNLHLKFSKIPCNGSF